MFLKQNTTGMGKILARDCCLPRFINVVDVEHAAKPWCMSKVESRQDLDLYCEFLTCGSFNVAYSRTSFIAIASRIIVLLQQLIAHKHTNINEVVVWHYANES